MLALEPTAQIFSSTGVNPGVPEIGPFAVGEFEVESYVSQDAVFDSYDSTAPGSFITRRVDTVAVLDAASLWKENLDFKILQLDPSDATKFQINRKLYIAYPASSDDPGRLAGSGRLPLVLLVHGHHDWYDVSKQKHVPNHRGYIYLQRELASWGIVSVSVDTIAANALGSLVEMRAEIILKSLDAMWDMDTDSSSLLYQRLDFNNVGLMGHSRGGDAMVRAAIINRDSAARATANINRGYGIKAVCSLAPTDYTGIATSGITHLNSPQAPFYAVVYGALDNDVGSFGVKSIYGDGGTGFGHYDRANTRKAMVFLDLCDHNSFNDVWSEDDMGLLQIDIDTRLLSRPQHRDLAKEYIGGLFRWQLMETGAPESLFDGVSTNSVAAHASIQWSFGNAVNGKMVTQLDDMESASPNVGSRSPSALAIGKMADVVIGGNKIGDYTSHKTSVLHVFGNPGATPSEVYKLTLPGPTDWSKYDQFIFRVCADADLTDEASIAGSALPNFTFVFTDSTPASAQVTGISLRTAQKPRTPVYHQYGRNREDVLDNCTIIRLETFAIDLDSLSAVDLTRITEVALIVPGKFTTHQFFDSFELVKR